MTIEDNERELRGYLQPDTAFDHGVEWLLFFTLLALLIGCVYCATHIVQVEEAHEWITNLLHW